MERTLNFEVKSNSYIIESPTIGQMIQVEQMKSVLSNGQYGALMANRTWTASHSLDTIDCFADLSILCPDLIKSLNVNDWTDLDPLDAAELLKAYKKQFVPWYNAIIEAIKEATKIDED